ncbi:MAG: TIGR04282 family arsenosugar biosynthesis glycosyltransferase [Bacteroidota bacterium]
MSNHLLLIFVKDPEPGKSKTRLAATLGHDIALAVYRDLLAHTCEQAQQLHADKAVFYGNRIPEQDLWAAAGFPRFLQQGEDLGARMEQAFSWGFAQGYERICIIGSDCATLSTSRLEEAFQALDASDMVLGPALDGGYYLLGMKKLFTPVFRDKIWSTDQVLIEALKDIDDAGKSRHLLPPLSDVDVEADLKDTFLAHYLAEKPKEDNGKKL